MLTDAGQLRSDWAQDLSRRIAERVMELEAHLDNGGDPGKVKPLTDIILTMHKLLPNGLVTESTGSDAVGIIADAYAEE
jgi:uncharacterized Fe-S cluster-containing radical SAM superfamily enzyme